MFDRINPPPPVLLVAVYAKQADVRVDVGANNNHLAVERGLSSVISRSMIPVKVDPCGG